MNKFFLCALITFSAPQLLNSINAQLENMSLEDKVAQLIMPGVRLDNPESVAETFKLIAKHPFCGLLLVNAGKGFHQNTKLTEHLTVEAQKKLLHKLQGESCNPLLIAQDLEWGLGMRMRDGITFPRALALGAIPDETLVYDIAHEIGNQARYTGVHINFAPVIDVNNNPANPVIHDRSFGDNKEAVARKGILFMQGLHDAGVMACAKHFPGHGDTDVDSHYDLPTLAHNKERFHELELYPFKQLIAAGVPMVMTAHLHIPALDAEKHSSATLSSCVITDLLKQELGFKGIVVTDSLHMRGITNYFSNEEAAVRAFLAGNDILLDPVDPVQAIQGICAAVRTGTIKESDIDARVTKILTIKAAVITKQEQKTEYSYDHAHQLKKQAYQQAITLVRDPHNNMPLSPRTLHGYIQIGNRMPIFTDALLKQLTLYMLYMPATPVSEIQEDTVIVALSGLSRTRSNNYGITPETVQLLNDLVVQGKQVVIVVFGTPYAVEYLPQKATVLVAYDEDDVAQQAAGNIVAGMQIAIGRLPIAH
jgi:beta-N-acetylhexosaminidase